MRTIFLKRYNTIVLLVLMRCVFSGDNFFRFKIKEKETYFNLK